MQVKLLFLQIDILLTWFFERFPIRKSYHILFVSQKGHLTCPELCTIAARLLLVQVFFAILSEEIAPMLKERSSDKAAYAEHILRLY